MFSSKCFDMNGKAFPDRLFEDHSSSVAETFVHHIDLMIDMLNGMPRMNARYTAMLSPSIISLQTTKENNVAIAFTMFISYIHKIPGFSPEQCFNPANANFKIFLGFAELLQHKITDLSITTQLIELVSKLKIEGISKIQLTVDYSANQYRLRQLNFPDDLLPAEYLCALTNVMMTHPTVDKNMPNAEQYSIILDRSSFLNCINKSGTNPYNRQPLAENQLKEILDLKSKIDLFMAKIECLCALYTSTYESKYKEFNNLLKDEKISYKYFEKSIQPKSTLKNGFFNTSTTDKTLQDLYKKFKLVEDSPAGKKLEKLLRCIAVNGNAEDLAWLLENFDINTNAADSNISVSRTAAHWVIIKANEKPEENEKYLACFRVLLEHGCDPNKHYDANQKLAMDYDKSGQFTQVLSNINRIK